MPDNKTLKALHDLVATCNDAAEGFAKAAKAVRNTELSNWLAQASTDREDFAANLSHAIKHLGNADNLDVHDGGILHRGWLDLEQHSRSKQDSEIVRECIAGDSGSLKHYDHALAQELDPDLRELIIEQKTLIDDNLTYLEGIVRGAAKGA